MPTQRMLHLLHKPLPLPSLLLLMRVLVVMLRLRMPSILIPMHIPLPTPARVEILITLPRRARSRLGHDFRRAYAAGGHLLCCGGVEGAGAGSGVCGGRAGAR